MFVITFYEVNMPTLELCGAYQGVGGGLLEVKQFEPKEKALARIKRQIRIDKTHWRNNLQGKEQGYDVQVQEWEKETDEVIVILWHNGKVEHETVYNIWEIK